MVSMMPIKSGRSLDQRVLAGMLTFWTSFADPPEVRNNHQVTSEKIRLYLFVQLLKLPNEVKRLWAAYNAKIIKQVKQYFF